MTDTIRLSDRLELRYHNGWELWRDGQYAVTVASITRDALIAACNPPRYDLPTGVIAGSDGKFYVPGDVVRTLPDEMWATYYASGNKRIMRNAQDAVYSYFYEVRPTAANPLKPLPPFTFPLPDGTLACFRRDAAKLREAGARVLHTDNGVECPARFDADYPTQVLRVEFPPTPKTERVHWATALQQQLPLIHNGGAILSYVARPDARATNPVGIDLGPVYGDDNRCVCPVADGTVEVLLTDTER